MAWMRPLVAVSPVASGLLASHGGGSDVVKLGGVLLLALPALIVGGPAGYSLGTGWTLPLVGLGAFAWYALTRVLPDDPEEDDGPDILYAFASWAVLGCWFVGVVVGSWLGRSTE